MNRYHRVLALLLFFGLTFSVEAKKIKSRMPVAKQKGEIVSLKGTEEIRRGEVTSDGLSTNDIHFSGYDKKATSDKESFFVTNRTDRKLCGIDITILYQTTDGRLLHRRIEKINCEILPGETEKIDIPSWDSQKSFHYYLSPPPKRRISTPYVVQFETESIHLRYKNQD